MNDSFFVREMERDRGGDEGVASVEGSGGDLCVEMEG